MVFVINSKKYDTEKMEKVADVKKEYDEKLLGTYFKLTRDCELWKSKKGNWLLTHESGYKVIAEAINEMEAKNLLMKYDLEKYEELFGDLEEA